MDDVFGQTGSQEAMQWLMEHAGHICGTGGVADHNARAARMNAAIAIVSSVAPRDALESMLAVQMVGIHAANVECLRRADVPGQSTEVRQANLSQANRLARTFAAQMEALNRHRGKGQQKVTVEHVHVHQGGQAIVGNVEKGEGR
jgi:hypothetical protein